MGLEATMRSSVESILRNQEDNGAFIASPDFAEYHYCWLRDSSFIAFALDQVGEHDASARYHGWVNLALEGISDLIDRAIEWHRQGKPLHPDHMPPARFALDGSNVVDDWPNFQIDGYGTWLWSFGQHLLQTCLLYTSRTAALLEVLRSPASTIGAADLGSCSRPQALRPHGQLET